VSPTCGSCGAALTEGARFCSVCGAAVEASAVATQPRREERKVVTALFADIVGSTALAERMDPEDFRDMVREAMARMGAAVERFGGEVFEYRGDGILVLLGAPIAHEDDPERAILAALGIVESISAYSREVAVRWGIEGFAVRIGIETGLAVLGEVGGEGKLAYGAVGDVLNTAARLQGEAEAGSVLVGPRTHRLTADTFEFDEPLELSLKGKAEPVAARRALRPRAAGLKARGVAAQLVGRDGELRRGIESIDEVLAGAGRVLFVTGEAGIGKSRLVAELRDRFEAGESLGGQPRWFEGRCVSYGEALPYWPFRGLLREWLGELAGEGEPAAIATALERELTRLAGERGAELIEPLALILASAAEAEETPDAPPQVMQERIHAAAVELFERLAAEGPVALAVDDLHWADASSLALLERLLELAERAPILLALVSRPEREHAIWAVRERSLRELAHRSRELSLEPLGAERDRELLAALTGAADLPGGLERRLLARAEGNPFFLEELVRSMVEAGALRPGDGGWTFDREVPVELPETVEKLILARIDRLSAPAQNLLGVAAVLGRQFPVALLERVAGDGDSIGEALRELESAELLREGPRWPVPFLVFRHTLIQESAYRGLLRRHRQELHAAAIDATEALYPDRLDEFAALLAYHADAAGDDRRSLHSHHRAGQAAARLYSVTEAIEHFDAALAAAERLGLDASDPLVRRAAHARGRLHFQIGELDASREDLEVAMTAAREAGDHQLEVDAATVLASYWRSRDFDRATELIEQTARAAEGMPPLARVDSLARLAIQYVHLLRLDRADAAAKQALALASADGDERSADRAKDALKLVAQQLGDVDRLEELSDDLLASLGDRAEDEWYLPWVLLESGFVPLARGRWDEASERFHEALELTRSRGRRYQEPLFLDAVGWLHRMRGDYQRAIENGGAAADLAHELGAGEWASWAEASLGWTLIEAGSLDEAARRLEPGLRTAEATNAPAQIARCTCLLACARSLLGDPDEAGKLAERGEALLDRVTAPPGQAWLYGGHAFLALGRVHLEAGEPERARAIAAPILEAAERTGWGPALAGAALLGELSPR
jgi:class 3 adenylate cyclase/tetratricopeptide (TPR) repeat protein